MIFRGAATWWLSAPPARWKAGDGLLRVVSHSPEMKSVHFFSVLFIWVFSWRRNQQLKTSVFQCSDRLRLMCQNSNRVLSLLRNLINLSPNLPIKISPIIPITGIINISGAHTPSVNTGVNASSSFISVALCSRLSESIWYYQYTLYLYDSNLIVL